MLNKILIANRGEIAVRIMRACRELGIKTVAIFSDADQKALFVRYADEKYNIGPGPASQSYLNKDRIIDVALKSETEGIHPGYGFMAENAEFSEMCHKISRSYINLKHTTIIISNMQSCCVPSTTTAKTNLIRKGFNRGQ